MIIYGAGLAGLLAANVLRQHNPEVREAQSCLPNNHSALLRFRSDKVGAACAIQFKKVRVNKAIRYGNDIIMTPNLFMSNMYSQKVTGAVIDRSINNLDPVDRHIAPPDLISKMSEGCRINYNEKMTKQIISKIQKGRPIISTIPMPVLMKMVGWKEIPEFPKQKIWTYKATIDDPHCDVYQTIYYPSELLPYYRVSIIGNVVISEAIRKTDYNAGSHIHQVLYDDFGIQANRLGDIKESEQEYGKIMPIDEHLRKRFIFEMTTKHNIYSVGRFATWRQLLLDDVVEDIQHIEQFIKSNSDYSRWMHSQKGEKT